MEINRMMMPTTMYHHHHYHYPSVTSYFSSPIYRGGLPSMDALATGSTALPSRSDRSPYYDGSPGALTGVCGPQLPSTNWNYSRNGGSGAGSAHCVTSPRSSLQSCKFDFISMFIFIYYNKALFTKDRNTNTKK